MARLPVKKAHTSHRSKRVARDGDQERVKQQKLYYYEKQLHKAVKKAKEFEIRKVSRRLKQALENQAGDGTASRSQAAATQKLQLQLGAAKMLGLDDLAKQAVESIVRNGEQTAAQHHAKQPQQQESQAAALVRARILSAKCVQETLEVARQALARIEAAAAKLPSTDAQLSVDPEEAAPDSPTGPDSSDDESRHAAPASASSGDDALDGRPEEVYEAASTSADELSEDAEELAAKRRKLLGTGKEGAQTATAQKKQPKPPPPKKRKNRLGQRARKLLAGAPQHGPPPLKTSRHGQMMKSAAQPGGQIGRPATKIGPLSQNMASVRIPEGIISMKQQPPADMQHDKPGQAKGGKQEQLHPSWVAKKALAGRAGLLAQPQGTKVLFDDDD